MAEQLNLTTPIPSDHPDTLSWKVILLNLDWLNAIIRIRIQSNAGEIIIHTISGVEATNLMIALNTANLSVKSLQRRILERLIADGVKVGTISGDPD